MVKSDKNMLFLVIVAVLAIMTLGGLGNAAYSVKTFYWIPFALDIPFFVAVCVKLFKAADKAAKEECADKRGK